MDAAHDVEHNPPPAPGEVLKTAESLREEIEATSRLLHDHVDQLREQLQHRLESFRNPLGLRKRVVEHAFGACGVAFGAGVLLGLLRGVKGAEIRRVGSNLGGAITGQVVSRVLDRLS
ncbi:MAG: hypothetical protein ACK5GN_04495 [Pseudomonadota bacterium]|jgi:hypothetical protein